MDSITRRNTETSRRFRYYRTKGQDMNKNVIAVLAVTMALLATAATRHRATLPPGSTLPLSLTRSFAVTDVEILQGFPFARVVDAIAERSGVAGATGAQLIRQLYDTQ